MTNKSTLVLVLILAGLSACAAQTTSSSVSNRGAQATYDPATYPQATGSSSQAPQNLYRSGGTVVPGDTDLRGAVFQ